MAHDSHSVLCLELITIQMLFLIPFGVYKKGICL